MKAWLVKVSRGTRSGLLPTDDAGRDLLAKMGEGECAEFSIVRPRSLPMHRRFFAILSEIGENQDPKRDAEDILDELKVLAGHYQSLIVSDPKSGDMFEVRRPKSIAFHRLTHDQWMELWPSLEQAGIQRFGETYWLERQAA